MRANNAGVNSSQAQVAIAALVPENIRASEETVQQRTAQVAQARANLAQAALNLSYTELRAPQDGWVTRRNVDLGSYAQAGQQVFYLVTTDVWVVANFKETQLNRMQIGQRVGIGVDAYPGLKLTGHVQSVQTGSGARFSAFPAENATGNFVKIVRRVPVKILIDHGLQQHSFLPLGLSVEPHGVSEMSDTKGGANIWLIACVVTLGAFMEVLDTTIVNVALPHIAGSLAVSNDEATWALTTYLCANGIVLTISGNLSLRLGRKKYFLMCIAGFTIASFMCGVSTSFVELLAFRAIQGFFGGGLQPTQQAIILDTFPPAKRQQAFSLTAIATIIAPVLGPVVGGYLTDQYTWHWIFLINVPIGAMTFFGVMNLVQEPSDTAKKAREAPSFDYWGVLFITMALGCLEVGVDRGEDLDWFASPTIRVLLGVSAFGFVIGIGYLLSARNPVVNLRVFRNRNFAVSWLAIGLMGFILYASAVLIPQFAQQQLGYTATLAGLVLAPGAIVLVMLIPVAGKLLSIIPVKYIIAAGGVALGLSLFYSENLVPQLDFFHLMVFRAAQTAALALLFVPISTAAYATLPPEQNGDAAALFTMGRNVLGGIGISVSTALVTDHSQIHQQYMIEHLSPVNQPYQVLLQDVTNALVGFGQSAASAMTQAPGQVFSMLRTQEAVLAYNDVFFITGCLSFTMVPLALLLAGGKQRARSGE